MLTKCHVFNRFSVHRNDRILHRNPHILRSHHRSLHIERSPHNRHNQHNHRSPHSLHNHHNGNSQSKQIQLSENHLGLYLYLYNWLAHMELNSGRGILRHLSVEDHFEIDSFMSPPSKHFLQQNMMVDWVLLLIKGWNPSGRTDTGRDSYE
ncbi:MAG: hypothetical protein WBV93_12440 [Anaerobacillus sp.]